MTCPNQRSDQAVYSTYALWGGTLVIVTLVSLKFLPWGSQTAPAAGGAPKVKLPVGNKLLQQQELAIIAI